MPKKLQLQSAAKPATNNFDIEKAKGRPMLQWVSKRPLDKVEYYPAQEKEIYGDKSSKDFNKLFWGDNLQVLAHLLKEYRGKIDLIYIDPPFDSKAEYVRKVKIRGEKITGQPQSLLEEKQYADIWEKDEYLQFMYDRLTLMRELLTERGFLYCHLDWHKNSYLRVLLDEVFGSENFRNEIIARRINKNLQTQFDNLTSLNTFGDTVYIYAKSPTAKLNAPLKEFYRKGYWHSFKQPADRPTLRYKLLGVEILDGQWMWNKERAHRAVENYKEYVKKFQSDITLDDYAIKHPHLEFVRLGSTGTPEYFLPPQKNTMCDTLWDDIIAYDYSNEYPTAKSENFLQRIIEMSSRKGDVVGDFFCGSGVAPVVAQKLGRRWIACDINLGAIQTTTKRLNQIIVEQQKKKDKNFKGLYAFKVLNVNDYDIFKNELEAKEIVMEMYGVEPIKRSYFDGVLDNNFVKAMPLNRVLNKMDIRVVLKEIDKNISTFNVKKKSKTGEPVYEEGVLIIASGVELDVSDFLKKENKTGVKVEIRDILTDKKNLIFKKKPEAKIEAKAKDKKLSVELKEFYSPILMRKLELENGKVLKKDHQAKVADFKQIIDSVAVDVDYNGKLFNAEIIDLPTKKELIKAKYNWEYPKKGKYTVAVKIVDVLGEEYFETFSVIA